MKQPKSLQPSIYKACSDLYIRKLSKMGLCIKSKEKAKLLTIYL